MSRDKPDKADMEAHGGSIINGSSQDPKDYTKQAVQLFMAGNREEAVGVYHQAIDVSNTNLNKAHVSTELGWLHYEIGQRDEGQAMAQSALGLLSQEPETGEVIACRGATESLLAHCLWVVNREASSKAADRAIECLNHAIDDTELTEKGQVYLDAAIVHYLVGNVQQAVTLCEACLQCELGEWQRISCLTVHAGALRRDGKFKEAEKAIIEALECARNYKTVLPNLYVELGLIQSATNDLPEAYRTFQQALVALDADPHKEKKLQLYGEIYINLGAVCFNLQTYTEAITWLKECFRYHAKDDDGYWNATLWLGHCYHGLELHDDARAYFKDVLASAHATEIDKSSALKALGELFYESGEYEKAAEIFQAVLIDKVEDDVNHWNTLLWLGNCYEAIGASDKALDYYDRILSSVHALESDKESARAGALRLPPHPKKNLH